MALIKCAHCGQTVLSVACTCPKCFTPVPRDVAEPAMNATLIRRGAWGAGILLATIGIAVSTSMKGSSATQVRIVSAAAKPGTENLNVIKGPLKVKPRPQMTADTSRQDTQKRNADSSIADARRALALAIQPASKPAVPVKAAIVPAPKSVTVAVAPVADSTTEVKWVSRWANVRGAPNADSQVVSVLKPGQQVAVVRSRGGWFSVLENGRQVGFVARQVLSDELPNQ